MISLNIIQHFTYDVLTDVTNYLGTQFFYERDKLLHQWLIQNYGTIMYTLYYS